MKAVAVVPSEKSSFVKSCSSITKCVLFYITIFAQTLFRTSTTSTHPNKKLVFGSVRKYSELQGIWAKYYENQSSNILTWVLNSQNLEKHYAQSFIWAQFFYFVDQLNLSIFSMLHFNFLFDDQKCTFSQNFLLEAKIWIETWK